PPARTSGHPRPPPPWVPTPLPAAPRASDAPHRQTNRLVVPEMVQQLFVGLDEGRLLLRIELARHCLWFAMFHPKPVQQSNQAAAALILDAEFALDPRADLERRPRQPLTDPPLQLLLLVRPQ